MLTLAARAQEQLGDRAQADALLARASWPVRPSSNLLGGTSAVTAPPADVATAADNIPYIRALLMQGRTAEAIDRAGLLARANPGAPAAHVVLGDALVAAGRPADAARSFEAAANIRFDRNAALRLVCLLYTSPSPRD